MKRMALSEARDRLSSIVNEVAHGSERIVLESHGRAKAAIVGIRDLERLEAGTREVVSESEPMLRWLEEAERNIVVARDSGSASLDALRDVREQQVADSPSLYRRQRGTQADRRRRR